MRIPTGFISLIIPSRKQERECRSASPENIGNKRYTVRGLTAGRSGTVSATDTGNATSQAKGRSCQGEKIYSSSRKLPTYLVLEVISPCGYWMYEVQLLAVGSIAKATIRIFSFMSHTMLSKEKP